jgi:hypothetical protein
LAGIDCMPQVMMPYSGTGCIRLLLVY